MKIIIIVLVLFFPFYCYEEHAFALNADHTIHLAFKNSHISLAADGTSLLNIIETISAETGITIKIIGDLSVNPVTTNFTDLTIEEALQRLLHGTQNYIMLLDSPKSISIILVADEQEKGDKNVIADEQVEKGDKNVIVDKKTDLSILEAALADEDESVRAHAVQVLANREDPDAMRNLREGFRDSDPSVRIRAVQSVTPQGQGLTLLQEAVSDPDPDVRSAATSRMGGEGR